MRRLWIRVIVTTCILVFGVFSIVVAQHLRPDGLAESEWPMYQGAANHNGQSSYTGITTRPIMRWAKQLCGGELENAAGMVIAPDGLIYVGACGGLHAINPETGAVKWIVPGGFSRSTPAINEDGYIYWGYDDTFLAISATGQISWSVSGLSYNYVFGSSPVIAPDGSVYFGHDGLWAFDHSGNFQWAHSTWLYNHNSPALGPDGTIYFSGDWVLNAVDPNGSIKWQKGLGNPVETIPTVGSDGTIYAGGQATNTLALYALNPDGTERWIFTGDPLPNSEIDVAPSIGPDGTIYFVTRTTGPVAYLYAVDSNGILKWKFPVPDTTGLGAWILAPPVIDRDENIFFCAESGSCYGLDSLGNLLWEYQIEYSSRNRTAPLIVRDGNLLILHNGTLYSFVASVDSVFLPLIAR